MAKDNPFIHIRSPQFPIQPGEEEELLNDGIYGKALATYLRERLIQRGYQSPFVCCEDWGWWVELKGQPFRLGLQVYGFPLNDIDEDQDEDALDLCVQVREKPERCWSWTRFRFIDRGPTVEKLNRDLKQIVESDAGIEVLGYRDEFPLG